MWKCIKCKRIFQKIKQPHTCRKVALESHFRNKDRAKELFHLLLKEINKTAGKTKTVSLQCCIHLYGTYDFLAALPKKDRLEVRFGLDRKLDSKRLKTSVPLSARHIKNCIDIMEKEEIDSELLGWIKEAYDFFKYE